MNCERISKEINRMNEEKIERLEEENKSLRKWACALCKESGRERVCRNEKYKCIAYKGL